MLLFAILTGAAGPVAEPTPRILDATLDDCRSLAGRLAMLPAARFEPSRSLGEQGVKMCDEGQLRIGVAKLRRALRAAQEQPPPASAAGTAAGTRSVTR